MSSIVSVRNVSKDYMLGKTVVHALDDVSLEVQGGDFLSIAGPSGSGKTTLLNLVGCVDTATRGSGPSASTRSSRRSGSRPTRGTAPASSPGASDSASRWRARSSPAPRSCSRTSRPATSTRGPARASSIS